MPQTDGRTNFDVMSSADSQAELTKMFVQTPTEL